MGGTGIVVGCCGWPEGRAPYFREFQAVELQDTFYDPPALELALKWRDEAPRSFHFTIKAWQLITHTASSPTWRKLRQAPSGEAAARHGAFQATDEVWRAWERTLAIARALCAPVILFQCPASFSPNAENVANLRRFVERVPRDEERLLAWEPRGAWPPDLVRDLCRSCGLVHAVDPFSVQPAVGHALYFRLHGRGAHHYRYADEELRWLRDRCTALVEEGRGPIYVMFNNTSMREDALRFRALMGEAAAAATAV